MHIAIAGNIGVGKTTLCKMLSKNYKWTPLYEAVDNNPYLDNFYDDMQRWSFNLQVFFLNSRFRQVQDIAKSKKTIIQDRTIYEDAYIFAPNLQAMGLMTQRDYDNYLDLFKLMESFVSPPDLLIYLRSDIPALVEKIQSRGREYEEGIRIDYLKRLNERYEAFFANYQHNHLTIQANEIDFQNRKSDLGFILEKIDSKLSGVVKK